MKKKTFILASLAATSVFALSSCNLFKKKTNPDEEKVEFDFSIALASGKTTLEIGDVDTVTISSTLKEDSVTRVYTYESSNSDRLSVNESGYVVANSIGSVKLKVTESNSQITKSLDLNVVDTATLASGGFNYSSSSTEQDVARRTEILGKLEKYAIESHLTGISLFENGGFVKYRDRLEIPAKEYITGYGFGILSEGDIKSPLAAETVEALKMYYHSAQIQDPNKINAWNASGSAVSDLNGYITSSYWGTKMNSTKDGYEWYPVLAKDEVGGKAYTRPTPVYEVENPLGLYKTWRIYVKTGEDGLKYRYNGKYAGFDKKAVELEDYAFVFQLLLTGDNKQSRGAEMAGDKTYGIKGAQAYYERTKDKSQAQIDAIWKEMTLTDELGKQDASKFSQQKLGIMVGQDEKGKFLQLEILNEMDSFTAMYQLSSNLYSPIPRSFIEAIGEEPTVKSGIKSYGINYENTSSSIVDNTISLGAYYLEDWTAENILFKQDDSWIERSTYPDRHKIKGVKIRTYPNATQDQLYMYYDKGELDSCGIPQSKIAQESDSPDVRRTKGDSTFKLNVNSCTQERWDELDAKLWKNPSNKKWTVKPWMSNENFLNGLYWSIDRETFATNRGAQPSIEYFSSAYLSDPENGVSYNDSEAHKQAIAKWHTVRKDTGKDNFGYDYDKAVACFKNAVAELAQQGKIEFGSPGSPTVINIHIRWMYQTDIAEYGNQIKKYFETAFNDSKVSNGTVKLEVLQDAVTNWEEVYNDWMMKGRFDLAFGAISGNTYNPLNFLEVLRSDNSSTFTLNWGVDTGKVDSKNPIIYDGHKWSFDSLWEVSDRGGVVDNGVSVKTCKNYYFGNDSMAKKISDGTDTDDFRLGVNLPVNLEFVKLGGVEIEISKVQIYVVGGPNINIPTFTFDKSKNELEITISEALGSTVQGEINTLYNKDKEPGDAGYVTFTRSKYNTHWTFEVYFTLRILGGSPSESYVTLAKTQAEQK